MIKMILSYLPSVVVPTLVSLFTTILYGNYMNPEDYGEYNIFITTISIIYTLLFSFVATSSLRYYNSYSTKNERYKIVSTYTITALILLGVLLVVMLPFKRIESLIVVGCIGSIAFYNIYSNLLRASDNKIGFNIVRISVPIGTLFIVLYLAWKSSLNSNTAIFSLYIPMGITTVIISLTYFKKGLIRIGGSFSRPLLKESLIYGIPLAFSGLLNIGLSSSDRYLINYFLGSKDVGIYSFAYRIAELSMVNVTMVIMLALYPQLVKEYDKNGKIKAQELLNKYLVLHFIAIIPVVALIILYVDELMKVIFPAYKEGIPIIKLTVIGTFFFTISNYTDKVFQLTRNTREILIILLISGIVNFLLNIAFIPFIGVQGAVLATVFSYILYIVLSIIKSNKYMKIQFPFKKLLFVLCLNGLVYLLVVLTIDQIFTNDLIRAIVGITTYVTLYSIIVYLYNYRKSKV
ncbi:polysaccharide biosynthesis C-terminal domain-containing protein [Bacillus sp. H8-1]|nr:polysaccharide biosynthesis C-terminal domain-containing protein [Bacillus sp. H8-1]